MNKGIDKDCDCTGEVGCIKAAGYSYIASYINRTARAETDHIASQGLYNVSIFETVPTSYGYFSAAQGASDAIHAMKCAEELGQPLGTPIYFTVDYDATAAEAAGEIAAYFGAVREEINKGGGGPYAVGCYANGAVLFVLSNLGLIEKRWLSMSKDWNGSATYEDWDIKQMSGGTLCGISVDFDLSKGAGGGWQATYGKCVSAIVLTV